MPSFEERFYLQNASFGRRVQRNLSLLWYIAGGAWAYLWPGLKLRRAYRRAERDGGVVSLEEHLDDAS